MLHGRNRVSNLTVRLDMKANTDVIIDFVFVTKSRYRNTVTALNFLTNVS